jgi:hypothetical protein
MRGLNSRSFLSQWRTLCAHSNPSHLKDRWQVDGVEWTRERHSHWGEHYSLQLEVHRLDHRWGNRLDWRILVVVERWWGSDREKCIRETCWCRPIAGSAKQVLAWMKAQDPERASRTSVSDTPRNG